MDFDSGHTDHHRVQVLITESTTPESDDNRGTPSGFWKGGQFYPQTVNSGGTVTFPRHSGHNWLEANRNYFLIISSKSASDDVGPTLRLTAYEGQTSDDGWTVDNHSYSKEKADHARWTKQDHPVRFRISGQFHQGLSLFEEPHAHESCPNKPCVVAVLETDENMGMEGRRFTGSMKTGNTWISTQENIEFKAALWPIPTGNQWVEFDYYTASGSATAGEDFHNASGTVRFSAGDKLKTIKVELIDDVHEDSGEILQMNIDRYTTTTANVGGRTYETGDLKVRTGGGYPLPDVSKYSALGTIHNSEETTETRYIRVSGATVTEGEETAAEFTISLSGVLTAPVWFNYTTVDGSAVAGTHYTATSGETHILHGATSVTVSVPILDHDDDVHTGDREFTLKLSNVTLAAIGTDSATVTIKDDEPAPLKASFNSLPEGNHGESSFTFNISFNHPVSAGYQTMQNSALTVTNGEITGAERVNQQSDHWRITARPNGGADVTVHLPATESCAADGAVCTQGDAPLPLSNSITYTFPGTQLNAKFEAFQGIHNGKDAFIVKVVFSEEVDTTADQLLNHAFTVENATLAEVIQASESSKRGWNITIKPTGPHDIKVTLLPATDCETDGQICTPDGELLTGTLVGTSEKPVLISVRRRPPRKAMTQPSPSPYPRTGYGCQSPPSTTPPPMAPPPQARTTPKPAAHSPSV